MVFWLIILVCFTRTFVILLKKKVHEAKRNSLSLNVLFKQNGVNPPWECADMLFAKSSYNILVHKSVTSSHGVLRSMHQNSCSIAHRNFVEWGSGIGKKKKKKIFGNMKLHVRLLSSSSCSCWQGASDGNPLKCFSSWLGPTV